jgi:Mg/Co/Ni transporter MgtE
VLIGIATIDDVLDVAEQEATEDIQRLGGSEALDEPYMKIAFMKMVQKRAGWLTSSRAAATRDRRRPRSSSARSRSAR